MTFIHKGLASAIHRGVASAHLVAPDFNPGFSGNYNLDQRAAGSTHFNYDKNETRC